MLRSGVLPAGRLKATIHANFDFGWKSYDRRAVNEVLDWLNSRAEEPVSKHALQIHLDELERRLSGELSILEVAARTKIDARYMRAPSIFLQHYRFSVFEIGELAVSVDILNPQNELSLVNDADVLFLEFFVARCSIQERCGKLFGDLIEEAARSLPTQFVFGGANTFLGLFLNSFRQGAGSQSREARVQDFLWPLTFERLLQVSDKILESLPVYKAVRIRDGVFVHVFGDLTNGDADRYVDAARRLGRRSVWELMRS